MRALIYLPVLVAPVIMGTMYYFVFQYRQGALNAFVTWIGFEKIDYFSNSYISIAIIILVNSLQFVGVSMVIYLAGLQTLDQSVIEAAKIDGASGKKMLWNITLPLLRPAFTTSVILNLIGGLKLYDVIVVLTGGGPGYATHSMSTYISSVYFSNQQAGYASAIGVVLFLSIAVVTVFANKLLNRFAGEDGK
ncbi:sugar ABC transporter permease [Arcanobacterium hippocoleae]